MPHVTSGNVTISRVDTTQGSFTMPDEDVTIDLSSLNVGELPLGAWVTYDTSTLQSVVAQSRTFTPATYSGGWRVISTDGLIADILAVTSVGVIYANGSSSNLFTNLTNISNAFINEEFASSARAPYLSENGVLTNLGLATPASWTSEPYLSQKVYLTDGSTQYYDIEVAFRPIITLRSDLVIKDGDGTQANPYVLEIGE